MTPTARSLNRGRDIGFIAAVVEKWNPHARIRQDLFGCIDLIMAKDGVGIIGVQACAGSSHAARKAKALAEPRLREWLLAGGRFEIWSWSKRGARGERKTWQVRREEIFAEDVHGDAGSIEPARDQSRNSDADPTSGKPEVISTAAKDFTSGKAELIGSGVGA